MISAEFTCKCGKMKAWVTEGEKTTQCPKRNRRYFGKYDPNTLTIEAIEIDKPERDDS